jgi:hypothetical protein
LATTPIAIVMIPAMSAVAAATATLSIAAPFGSPRMLAFTKMM